MRYDDERFEERLEVDFPVSVVGPDGYRLTRARNLSSSGLQVQRGLDPWQAGSHLELTLRLPEAPTPVCCHGTVVYQHGPLTGIEFSNVPTGGQRLIDQFIAVRARSLR